MEIVQIPGINFFYYYFFKSIFLNQIYLKSIFIFYIPIPESHPCPPAPSHSFRLYPATMGSLQSLAHQVETG